jgi:ABC-type transport system involved in multi-copper enzyme maturation permease subunit
VLTIVWLTWKEAFRRRAPIISLLIGLLLCVGLIIPLQGKLLLLPRDEANRIYTSLYIFFATDIVKFFAAIYGIALAAGAISAEIERGVLSAILPKPLPRFSVYAGKWIGLFLFIAANVVFWDVILYAVASYRAPGVDQSAIWRALPYVLVYPFVFVTLGLFFSTFCAFPLASGLTVLLTGIGWAEGMLYLLHQAFEVAYLEKLSKLAGYLMPLGRMARAVTDGMGTLPGMMGSPKGIRRMLSGGLFREIENGSFDLLYILCYAVCIFALGAILFGRRDV